MLTRIPGWVMIGSVLLAFCAGYINCIAFLGFAGNAVSHVTGNITLMAQLTIERAWYPLWQLTLIVISFLVGAMISGMLLRSEALKLGRQYGLALLIESLLLAMATLLFLNRAYGGEWLASMACGLQNAMVATYSGSVIRTTHLTGIVSDIGAAIGSFMVGEPLRTRQLTLQGAIAGSFFTGALSGGWLFGAIGYAVLLAPALLVGLAGVLYSLMRLERAA
ncbi:YoaK family protein [Kushneria phosphatilytica]|uniref:DUF1275 domain-containing protein n=1 Tax=Kushneria phosphatilytica TaxID=657387 RepID=A0A5C0ZYC9_9GAMM|nr:YoaK family protein [Kushneria phosphatilytica]QEL10373.1 DUF1275 domain-containing protein [Kushneria phosphatilytica]